MSLFTNKSWFRLPYYYYYYLGLGQLLQFYVCTARFQWCMMSQFFQSWVCFFSVRCCRSSDMFGRTRYCCCPCPWLMSDSWSILGVAFHASDRSISVTWRLDDSPDHLRPDPSPAAARSPDYALPSHTIFPPNSIRDVFGRRARRFCSSGYHGDRRRDALSCCSCDASWMTDASIRGKRTKSPRLDNPAAGYNPLSGKKCLLISRTQLLWSTRTYKNLLNHSVLWARKAKICG